MANNPYPVVPGLVQTYKEWDDEGQITPNVEYSEGQRPAGEFQTAPYLNRVRYVEYTREYIVLSQGKIVSFDINGYVVPAGLKIQSAAYIAAFNGAANAGAGIIAGNALTTLDRYTAEDVKRGQKNFAGVLVVAGEPVVKSFFNNAVHPNVTATNIISSPVGVSYMNFYPHPGGDGINPARFNRSNVNYQSRIGFLRYYQLELPLVADNATYATAPMAGIAACIAADGTVKPGQFVTYDYNSNFVVTGYDYGATDESDILGQVMSVRDDGPHNLLNRVRTAQNGTSTLQAMPGTATAGRSDAVTYSAGYGIVRICLGR